MGVGTWKRGDLVSEKRDDDSSAKIIARRPRNILPFERELSPGRDCRLRRLRSLRSFALRDSNYRAAESCSLDRKRQADALQPLRESGHARTDDSFFISNPFGGSLLSPGEQITIIPDVSKLELSSRIVAI